MPKPKTVGLAIVAFIIKRHVVATKVKASDEFLPRHLLINSHDTKRMEGMAEWKARILGISQDDAI